MLISQKNEYGAITVDDGLFVQLFNEAIKPFEGKAKYVGDKQIRFGENGLYASTGISIRMGNSISEICGSIIDFVAKNIEESLDIEIDDLVVEVVQMTTSKTTVKRSIKVSYRGGTNEEN